VGSGSCIQNGQLYDPQLVPDNDVERYIAVVYPLHYETKFTDRTLKRVLIAAWATGILLGMSYNMWLINADLTKCKLIPPEYYLVDLLFGYVPACIILFTLYGRILVIALHQRRSVEPQNVGGLPGAAVQTWLPAMQGGDDNTGDLKDTPLHGGSGTTSTAACLTASGDAAASSELPQRGKTKSRRREFKAVYLTVTFRFFYLTLALNIMLRVPPLTQRLPYSCDCGRLRHLLVSVRSGSHSGYGWLQCNRC